MTKEEQIEAILASIHNMIDVEDIKPQLEALWNAGHESGYAQAAEEMGQ